MFPVAEIADHEPSTLRNRPGEASREFVDDHGFLAVVEQAQDHMAADIAGATGD
jgi:hypothetical protein